MSFSLNDLKTCFIAVSALHLSGGAPGKKLDELSDAVNSAIEESMRTLPTEPARIYDRAVDSLLDSGDAAQEQQRVESAGSAVKTRSAERRTERTSRDNKDVEEIVSKILEMLKSGKGNADDDTSKRASHDKEQDHHHKSDEKQHGDESSDSKSADSGKERFRQLKQYSHCS